MKSNGVTVTTTERTPLLENISEDPYPPLLESNEAPEAIPDSDDSGVKAASKDKRGFLGVLSVLLIGKYRVDQAHVELG